MRVGRSTTLIALLLILSISSNAQAPRRRAVKGIPPNPVQLSAEAQVSAAGSGAAPFQQESPAIASDGAGFLVAWRDARQGYGDSSIVVSRLNREGVILDPVGVAMGRSDNFPPTVFWTGHHYLVLWSQFGSRVSQDGVLLDAYPRRIAPDGYYSANAFAWNGSSLLVTGGIPESAEKQVWLLDENLELAAAPRPLARLSVDRDWDSGFAAVSDGRDFLVARLRRDSDFCPTAGCYTIATQKVAADGTPLSDTAIVAASRPYGVMTLAAGGEGFLLLKCEPDGGVITGYVLATTGAVLRPPIALAGPGTASVWGERAAVIWTGQRWLVTWSAAVSGKNPIMAGEITPDGETSVRSFETSPALYGNRGPVTAIADGATMLAWTAWPGSRVDESDIFASRLDGHTVLDEITVSRSESMQDLPVASTNGSSYLVLWTEYGEGTRTLAQYARMFDLAGQPLGEPLVVRPPEVVSGATASPFDPHVDSVGGDYLVSWTDGKTVRNRRLSGSGGWIDDAPRTILDADCIRLLGTASGAGTYILLWNDCSGSAIRINRVAADGTLIDGPGVAIPGSEWAVDASVSWDGARYVVAWTELIDHEGCQILCPTPRTRIRMARLRPELTPDGDVVNLTSENEYPSGTVTASGGSVTLVAWQSFGKVFAFRVAGGGAILEPAEGAVALMPTTGPPSIEVVWDGAGFTVLTRDARASGDEYVIGTHVDPDRPLASQSPASPWVVSIGGYVAQSVGLAPAAASAGAGRTLIAYGRLPMADPIQVNRIYMRMAEFTP